MISKICPAIMGILNVTPDSFSDGGQFKNHEKAIMRAQEMQGMGASIIDIGGESSRPGALPVTVREEMSRVLPIVRSVAMFCPVSIDTAKASVAEAAIEEGATMVNDISALSDPNMLNVIADAQADIVIMHMQGTPDTMQNSPLYTNVIQEINDFFARKIELCLARGVSLSKIYLDPGIGFGKNLEDNLCLIKHIHMFKKSGAKLLLGTSRKSFINLLYPAKPNDRLVGTLATAAHAFYQGVDVLRVHDVAAHQELLITLQAIRDCS